ncbi:hypothetical protein D9611_002038 [Ephemerocybe angulata]|uniref:DUF7918 domain-containing protein n=1 Tax=Ephemerocybe angulata TaxID=980116 RepID=A0A8H5CJM4_9AGAR|nr:hypothetical protein D9611_002038 [Tulosesus angulatus]
MPHLRGFDAWIEVGGFRLEEYRVEVIQDGSRVSCWVPCIPGKEFEVRCYIPPEQLHASNHLLAIRLDGEVAFVKGNGTRQNASAEYGSILRFAEQINKKDMSTTRAFKFGSLELTDDDSYLLRTTKQFGEIAIEVYSFEGLHVTPDQDLQRMPTVSDEYRAHERAKKGLSHCVKLGEEKPITTILPPLLSVGSKKRICTFVFNYRHLDLLIANGIAPRSTLSRYEPATSHFAGKREVDELHVGLTGAGMGYNQMKDGSVPVDMKDRLQYLKAQIAMLKMEGR